jgi:hypothetical protein
MAYVNGGSVTSTDITDYVTSVNNILSALGQNQLSSPFKGSSVVASLWTSLNTAITNIASHQGTSLGGLPSVAKGNSTIATATLSTNITAINNSNAAAQGTTVTNFTEVTFGWYNYVTFTQSVTFASATAASYFFNAGGQIALQFLHPASASGIDGIFSALGSALGTLVMSGQSSGTRTIAGVSYAGFQRVGGQGSPSIYSTNLGYAGLTANSQTMFYQIGGTYTNPAPGGGTYSQNYIQVNAYTSNAGATINFQTTWDEQPNGLVTGLGNVNGRTRTTTYVLIRPPAATNITNSWGTPTFTGSVTGQ